MKTFRNMVAGLALLIAVACAGVTARDQSMRGMAEAWPRIAVDVKRGAPAEQAEEVGALVAQVGEALNSGARIQLVGLDWPRLRFLAEDGITARVKAGEIGLGVAEEKREKLRLFTQTWIKLLER